MIRVHHIGYVVRDLDRYAASLPGLEIEAEAVDPLQHARLALYKVGDGARIELIEPLSPEAYTWAHLDRAGEGLHHVCYEGIGAESIDAYLKQHRMMRVRGPMYAVLLDRPVVFAVTRQRAIVEFAL